ncbi:unnamed protein product [Cylindrotheca closterium]|uniref:Uncharacterized protein n=1 Tax=Cylindrotheca closterium TaxID=2856 RepID=A0AAD2CQU1_9STRA|nr:unnamed protein product [Cylindrotheca closterium]CAJ1968048.1 unnamed protein product [Cylindrotheca closterium]
MSSSTPSNSYSITSSTKDGSTRDEMERMVAEIRLAAKQTASEPVKPKDLTENEAQQMVTDIKAAPESEDSETSKELTEQEVHRMIVEMRQAAEKADSEEAAEREMQRMVDEMKWATEEQSEAEERARAQVEVEVEARATAEEKAEVGATADDEVRVHGVTAPQAVRVQRTTVGAVEPQVAGVPDSSVTKARTKDKEN